MGDKAIITEILEASHLTDAYHELAAHSLIEELVKHGKKKEESTSGAADSGDSVKYDRFEESARPAEGPQFGAFVDRTEEVSPVHHGPLQDIGPFQIADEDEESVLSDDESGLFPLLPSSSAGGAKVHGKLKVARVDEGLMHTDDGDTFTVDQAVDALGFGKFQIKLSILTGLAWMADAMEMMILSILSPALHCDWWIDSWQQAFITTVVFCGMMLSSTMWGNVADKYGRKTELCICTALTFYFGLLSALAPNFIWLLILRGLVGFGIGGLPQTVTLYAEFLPSSQRAKCVILIEVFWAIGTCFEVILALFIMPSLGWRWLLAFSAFPLLVFLLCCYWLPESARYHVACGQSDLAYATLKRVSEENGKAMLIGKLVESSSTQEVKRGRIVDLFVPELRDTTMLLWFIWLANAFSYYGIVLFTTELYESGGECHGGEPGSVHHADAACPLECHKLGKKDYVDLLWTTVAEFPGLIITIVIIEWLGRKKTMAIEFGVFSFFVFLLFLCLTRPWVTTFISFARMFISGAFQAAYVYTPEVYPTTTRAIGLGTCSGFARLGAIITPFVAQVALDTSVNIPVGVYGVTCVAAIIASMMLPIETKGRSMKYGTQQEEMYKVVVV